MKKKPQINEINLKKEQKWGCSQAKVKTRENRNTKDKTIRDKNSWNEEQTKMQDK